MIKTIPMRVCMSERAIVIIGVYVGGASMLDGILSIYMYMRVSEYIYFMYVGTDRYVPFP